MTRTLRQDKKDTPPPQKNGAVSTNSAPPKFWIVVADTAGAHIYQKSETGIERLADEDACCTHPFPLPDADVTDRDFLLLLADWLGEAAREEAFDRLALLGARETLALMRSHLPQDACERVCAALEKDVAEIRENEIEDHIISVVWV